MHRHIRIEPCCQLFWSKLDGEIRNFAHNFYQCTVRQHYNSWTMPPNIHSSSAVGFELNIHMHMLVHKWLCDECFSAVCTYMFGFFCCFFFACSFVILSHFTRKGKLERIRFTEEIAKCRQNSKWQRHAHTVAGGHQHTSIIGLSECCRVGVLACWLMIANVLGECFVWCLGIAQHSFGPYTAQHSWEKSLRAVSPLMPFSVTFGLSMLILRDFYIL